MTQKPEFARPPLWKRLVAYALILVVAVGIAGAVRYLVPKPIPNDWEPPGLTMANRWPSGLGARSTARIDPEPSSAVRTVPSAANVETAVRTMPDRHPPPPEE